MNYTQKQIIGKCFEAVTKEDCAKIMAIMMLCDVECEVDDFVFYKNANDEYRFYEVVENTTGVFIHRA